MLGITILGAVLRLVNLETLPPVNRDEVAIGYNAYSLLKTGHDEHGTGPWPISFRSFGDFKLPGLIYLSIPFQYWLGPTISAIRLPTTILGIGLIPLTYALVFRLTHSRLNGLVSALLLAISPWHIHSSRSAYEPLAALTINVLAVILATRISNTFWAMISFFSLSFISFLIYNQFIFIFTPLALGIWWWLRPRPGYFLRYSGAVAVMAIIVISISMLLVGDVNNSRFQTTIFNFNDEMMWRNISLERFYLNQAHFPDMLTKLFSNALLVTIKGAMGSYLAAFEGRYLFINGGNNVWHNLSSIQYGNFYAHELVVMGLGFMTILRKKNRNKAEYKFLLFWLLITPIAHAMTIDTPNTNRLLDFHYVLLIIGSLGIMRALSLLKPRNSSWKTAGVFLYTFSFIHFLSLYFFSYTPIAAKAYNHYYPQLVEVIRPAISTHSKIIIQDNHFGYIFFSYLLPIDPREFQQFAVRDGEESGNRIDYQSLHFRKGEIHTTKAISFVQQPNASMDKKALLALPAKSDSTTDGSWMVVRDDLGLPIWILYELTNDQLDQLMLQETLLDT